MQVNNASHSPSFGMALRVHPEALPAIKEKGMKYIKTLEEAGEALKDTKIYHLDIVGPKATPKITSVYANAYTGPFEIKEPTQLNNNFIDFNCYWAGKTLGNLKQGDKYSSCIMYSSSDAASAAYKKITSCDSGVSKAAQLTLELDSAAQRKDVRDRLKYAESERITKAADALFSKFGVRSI